MTAVTDSAFTPLVLPRVGDVAVDARAVSERARVRGYAEGFAEGRRRAQAELDLARREDAQRIARREAAAREELQSALAALDAARGDLTAAVAGLVGTDAARIEDLAIEMARLILGTELSDPASSAAHALRRAATEVPASAWLRLHLHERDLRILRDGGVDGLPGSVEIVASDTVDAGGAIIEIENASVDLRIVAALDRARDALDGGGADGAGG